MDGKQQEEEDGEHTGRTMMVILGNVERHLIPALGHMQLKNLHKQAIKAYYGKARDNKLSARTIHHYHRVLSQALKQAEIDGYIGVNPCKHLTVKVPRKQVMRTLVPSEVDILLETASDSYYYPVIYTAVSTGLRQAELLGLRWRDIDPDIMLSISVNRVLYKRSGVCLFKEPKTERSRRQVKMTRSLAQYLREYRAEREAVYSEMGKELTLDDLVFANIEGNPLDPSVLSHSFAKIVKQAGLEGVRFHDLRHTFASLMLKQGVHPKVVQEALGHSSVSLTLDIYSHIISGVQEDAMGLLDKVLPSGINGKNNAKLTLNIHNNINN